MGRPRKPFNRLTRTLTVRVRDDQYDWLVEGAVVDQHGDLSKTVREAIDTARIFNEILYSPDPLARFKQMLERSEEEAELEEIEGVLEDERRREG